jgi:hypothetical protein
MNSPLFSTPLLPVWEEWSGDYYKLSFASGQNFVYLFKSSVDFITALWFIR